MIDLGPVPAAAFDGWATAFDLFAAEPDRFLIIGGQMMQLLAAEHAANEIVRPTEDMDVVVNVRALPGGTQWLSQWLMSRGFEFAGAGPQEVGHRFTKPAEPGPGTVTVDVLAVEGLGRRADVSTVRPAHTVQVPASAQAFDRSDLVDVRVSRLDGEASAKGSVRRPNLLGALVAKAAATSIAVRTNPERDWEDAALLLSVALDPIGLAASCRAKDRKRLTALQPLLDGDHPAWGRLGAERRQRGSTTLEFLISG